MENFTIDNSPVKDLYKLSDNLTDAIKNSKCYTDYLNSKEHIKKNPELCKKIQDFRKKHTDLQKKKHNGEQIPFDYERSISREYFSLILDEDVKTFLENEQILIQLIGNIYNRITKECILEFEF